MTLYELSALSPSLRKISYTAKLYIQLFWELQKSEFIFKFRSSKLVVKPLVIICEFKS